MSDLAGWLLLALAVLLVLGWYLSFSASRIDRLHHRVESAQAALDAQLARRAGFATELATRVDPPAGPALAASAKAAIAAGTVSAESGVAVQNRLTRALAEAFDAADAEALRRTDGGEDLLAGLAGACGRAQLARRFHNDAVAQAQRVRRKRVVRWARLAGHAGMPQMVEIDDTVPTPLLHRVPTSAP